ALEERGLFPLLEEWTVRMGRQFPRSPVWRMEEARLMALRGEVGNALQRADAFRATLSRGEYEEWLRMTIELAGEDGQRSWLRGEWKRVKGENDEAKFLDLCAVLREVGGQEEGILWLHEWISRAEKAEGAEVPAEVRRLLVDFLAEDPAHFHEVERQLRELLKGASPANDDQLRFALLHAKRGDWTAAANGFDATIPEGISDPVLLQDAVPWAEKGGFSSWVMKALGQLTTLQPSEEKAWEYRWDRLEEMREETALRRAIEEGARAADADGGAELRDRWWRSWQRSLVTALAGREGSEVTSSLWTEAEQFGQLDERERYQWFFEAADSGEDEQVFPGGGTLVVKDGALLTRERWLQGPRGDDLRGAYPGESWTLRWRVRPSAGGSFQWAAANGTSFVALDQKGTMAGIDGKTGQYRWQKAPRVEEESPPDGWMSRAGGIPLMFSIGGVAYQRTTNGRWVACEELFASGGQQNWLGSWGQGGCVFSERSGEMGLRDWKTGELHWASRLHGQGGGRLQIGSDGERWIALSEEQGTLGSVDPTTGRWRWLEKEAAGFARRLLVGNEALIAWGEEGLRIRDPQTGTLIWEVPIPEEGAEGDHWERGWSSDGFLLRNHGEAWEARWMVFPLESVTFSQAGVFLGLWKERAVFRLGQECIIRSMVSGEVVHREPFPAGVQAGNVVLMGREIWLTHARGYAVRRLPEGLWAMGDWDVDLGFLGTVREEVSMGQIREWSSVRGPERRSIRPLGGGWGDRGRWMIAADGSLIAWEVATDG
ncbi:MAG: PQQ-binding-like beta-propeller repeat protein, partial [Verrucomicrobiota bacterium]